MTNTNHINDRKFNIADIKLIVGLGNLDDKYYHTRHNVGFDFLKDINTADFVMETKFKSLISITKILENRVVLSMPSTFMNKSGEAVRTISDYYKFTADEVLIVHDDLDIDIGKFKLQFNKGPRVHNGISSVERHLGTTRFWRLRIGVDNRNERQRKFLSGADYVLGKISKEELELNYSVFNTIKNEWKNEN
ncbi:MAG: aminoacyl-tRNA hydrolase [Candidatus Dojkabacteria bacterium]|nr:aminoacyl-tRNA hydrolase [Candidatus Dojkabacteria bacterium]MDQ7020891.1 aminoacyl-tRNA hydrolase [Candidatus Dojkabacteria bacterium]